MAPAVVRMAVRPSRAGREDVVIVDLEVDIAVNAFSHDGGAVAGPAGVRDRPTAERAVDDEAKILGGGLLVGLEFQLEAEPADDGQ